MNDILKIVLLLIIFFHFLENINADVLTFDEIRNIQSGIVKQSRLESRSSGQNNKKLLKKDKRINSNKAKILKIQLKETKAKLEAYRYISKMQLKDPIILNDLFIGEGTFLFAKLELGVMASNSATTLILSNLKGAALPEDSKISCQVIAKYKRVCGRCERLIINGEGYEIQAELKNRDGSNCVIGKMYDGKEKYLTGMMLSEMAKGALSISQSVAPTPFGNVISNTASNKIKQGLINSANETTDFLKEEYQTQEPMVFVNSGTDVIIQFKRKVQL